MNKFSGNIFPCSNSYIDKDFTFFSYESLLYRADSFFKDPSVIYQFTGGSRGLRSLFVSSKGALFVSPEGNHLTDEMKGLWKSVDKGMSWKCVLNFSSYKNPISIWGIDESSGGNLFAGVYTLAANESKAEIFRSCDEGNSWQLVYKDEKARHVHQITCDKYTGYIYASIGDNFSEWRTKSIVRSTDEGKSWQTILPDLPQIVPIIAIKGARLFASDAPGGARIYRTVDDKHVELVLLDQDELYFFWMRKHTNDKCLLASAISSSMHCKFSKIYRSLNKGLSWHLVEKFESDNIFDGSMNASNISDSNIIVHVWRNGTAREPLVPDIKKIRRVYSQNHSKIFLACSNLTALLLLLFSLPLMLVSMLLIKLTSKGPVLYFQTRYGLNGDTFRIVKLRTRYHRNGNDSSAYTEPTPLGKLLRLLSIDELPQFWNVMKGDMALVGPRPHPLDLDAKFQNEIPGIFKRYKVKPGMTGLAQASGARGKINNLEDLRARVKLDILYIRNKSLWLDIIIIVKTILGGFINKY